MKKGTIKNKLKRFGRGALVAIPLAIAVTSAGAALSSVGGIIDSSVESSELNRAVEDSILLHNYDNDTNATAVLNKTLDKYELQADSYEDALIYSRAAEDYESNKRKLYGALAVAGTLGAVGFGLVTNEAIEYSVEEDMREERERLRQEREEAKRIAAEEEARAILKKKEEEEELNADK